MPVFKHQFKIAAPLESVTSFHADTSALRLLTPPPAFVLIHRSDKLKNGAIAKFTIWLGLIPIHWTAVHENVSLHGFTDIQIDGPFSSWLHTHRFDELPDGDIIIRDQITAEFGKNIYHSLVSRVMWFTLPFLFRYRKWRTIKFIQESRRSR